MMGGAPGGGGAGGSKENKPGSLGLIAPKIEDPDDQIVKRSTAGAAGSRKPKKPTND